jgi:hypothetical protein
MIRKFSRRFLSKESKKKTAPAGIPGSDKLPFSPVAVERFHSQVPHLSNSPILSKPFISIVLIVYNMAPQAKRTMESLSTAYQRGVSAEDYEVIVVENESNNNLSEDDVTAFGENFSYFRRSESQPTPVFAINYGASKARGTHICVMIDGARMVTPGMVSYMLAAAKLEENAVIASPGYHLGPKLQQLSILEGYNQEREAKLLEDIQWPHDGYRLFEVACLSGTCRAGFFAPISESNCICVSRSLYERLGGFDEGFTETGGGQVNLDFYKRAVELPETVLFLLMGEGSFHQLHGGITTGKKGEDRKQAMTDHFAQYASLRGGPYSAPDKRCIYLGSVPDSAVKFINHGTNKALGLGNQD